MSGGAAAEERAEPLPPTVPLLSLPRMAQASAPTAMTAAAPATIHGTEGVREASGSAAPARAGLPQFGQNRDAASRGVPQSGQGTAPSCVPQLLQ